MKTKKFKTISNRGTVVNSYITLLDKYEYSDRAIGIITKRLVSEKELADIILLNEEFPIFMPIRKFWNKFLLMTKSAPIKLSTFKLINEFINQEQ